MKSLMSYIYSLLADFKYYRRKKGGVWYFIREKDSSGFAVAEYWTQTKGDDCIEIKREDYTKK